MWLGVSGQTKSCYHCWIWRIYRLTRASGLLNPIWAPANVLYSCNCDQTSQKVLSALQARTANEVKRPREFDAWATSWWIIAHATTSARSPVGIYMKFRRFSPTAATRTPPSPTKSYIPLPLFFITCRPELSNQLHIDGENFFSPARTSFHRNVTEIGKIFSKWNRFLN